MSAPASFKNLDVRPALARGEQPLGQIRRAVDGLAADEGLRVLAPFLPSPLIEMLRNEGFESRIERGRGADWVVYFWRQSG